jgi:hypothetical protein
VFNKFESVTELKAAKLIEEQRKTIANRNKRETIDNSRAFKDFF